MGPCNLGQLVLTQFTISDCNPDLMVAGRLRTQACAQWSCRCSNGHAESTARTGVVNMRLRIVSVVQIIFNLMLCAGCCSNPEPLGWLRQAASDGFTLSGARLPVPAPQVVALSKRSAPWDSGRLLLMQVLRSKQHHTLWAGLSGHGCCLASAKPACELRSNTLMRARGNVAACRSSSSNFCCKGPFGHKSMPTRKAQEAPAGRAAVARGGPLPMLHGLRPC